MVINKTNFNKNFYLLKESLMLLKEDELDTLLGLDSDGQIAAPTDDTNVDNVSGDTLNVDGGAIPDSTSADTPLEPIQTGDSSVVTLNISDVVNKQDEVLQTVQSLFTKIDGILSGQETFKQEVQQSLETAKQELNSKIEEIDSEVKKRNPTDDEKMWLNSLAAYPYNVKLTDYFVATKDPNIRNNPTNTKNTVGDSEPEEKEEKEDEEYIITQNDIDNYSETNMKKSFKFYA